MKRRIAGPIALLLCVLAAAPALADGYQQLSPIAAYSSEEDTYIIFAQNIGLNGCSLNKNNIAIVGGEQGSELVKSSLAIALAAISTGTPITVHWSGCLPNGRPKATMIGLGTAIPN